MYVELSNVSRNTSLSSVASGAGMSAADVADLSRRMRNVRAQLKRSQKEESLGELRGKFANCVLMVYIFSGHDLNVAAEYLAQKQLFPGSQIEERLRAVERVYLKTPTCQIVKLMNDSCLADSRHAELKAACRFIIEHRLFQWLKRQNCEQGVAPSRLQLVRHALSTLPQEPPLSVVDAVAKPLRGSARRQRKWLQNFRRKWGARLGKLRVATTMSQAELQEKAPCSVLPHMGGGGTSSIGVWLRNVFFLFWMRQIWGLVFGPQN